MISNWTFLAGSLVILLSAAAASNIANRRLFSRIRDAEEQVRRRCLANQKIDLNLTLDSMELKDGDREIARELLGGIASIIRVPPEVLRFDSTLRDMCGVEYPQKETKGGFLVVFADEMLEFIEQSLTEDQWVYFLREMNIPLVSEGLTLEGIFNHRLGEVIRYMTEAKSHIASVTH